MTRDGRLEAARGYGMANLEYGVPLEPSSIFHVASVSKHVTAFAAALLVSEGRVSWDDDIRQYVPELADAGHPIPLEHLVHHTSGVRDQWELLIMGGWRWEADLVRQRSGYPPIAIGGAKRYGWMTAPGSRGPTGERRPPIRAGRRSWPTRVGTGARPWTPATRCGPVRTAGSSSGTAGTARSR